VAVERKRGQEITCAAKWGNAFTPLIQLCTQIALVMGLFQSWRNQASKRHVMGFYFLFLDEWSR
jgi:hypothetical protein